MDDKQTARLHPVEDAPAPSAEAFDVALDDAIEDEAPELEGAELGAAILGTAKARFVKEGLRSIPIPELAGEDGKVPVIYARPLTPEERDRLTSSSTRRGELRAGEYSCRIVIAKALDRHGNRIWSQHQLNQMMKACDSQVWGRVAGEIMGDGFVDKVEEATGDAVGN